MKSIEMLRRMRAPTCLLLVAVTLGPFTVAEPAHASTFSCGGSAPQTTSCSSGSRKRVEGIAHNVVADFNYVGTLESSLDWNGGKRIFRCTYTQAASRSCISYGTFPPVNTSFTHRCQSQVPGSALGGVNPNGTQGGVGNWQCDVTLVTGTSATTTYTCQGTAPALGTSCTTGTRLRVDGLSHNVEADLDYVGTLESVLDWSGGKRVLRCTYTRAGSRSCLSSGSFPPVNTSFTHRCRSLWPGSFVDGVNPDGVAGGIGNWVCEVSV